MAVPSSPSEEVPTPLLVRKLNFWKSTPNCVSAIILVDPVHSVQSVEVPPTAVTQ